MVDLQPLLNTPKYLGCELLLLRAVLHTYSFRRESIGGSTHCSLYPLPRPFIYIIYLYDAHSYPQADARKMHTSFLSVCAGPLLLALAANACDDSSAPAQTPEYSGDTSKGMTPSPESSPSSSTDTAVAFSESDDDIEPEQTDGEGEEGEVEDEEGVPLEKSGDGEVCSTYDEDVRTCFG